MDMPVMMIQDMISYAVQCLMFKESPDIKAQTLIQAFVIGISGIEESYGDYICMTFKEV